jgi:phospholipid/cholesterol/gamma-HCH transport system substrate-binding protein
MLVIAATLVLVLLIVLMSGSMGGLLHKRITAYCYLENSAGLKAGAPVGLQGVTIGTVKSVRIDPARKDTPVQVVLLLSTRYRQALHKDSKVYLNTVGVLGDTVVDIDSSEATGPLLANGDTLPAAQTSNIQSVVRSSQSTILQVNMLVKKLNDMTNSLNSRQGTLGLLLNDPKLYNQAVATLTQLHQITGQISSGQGSLGKLIQDDTFYDRANETVARLQHIADELDAGQGTAGKLLKDPALYNNLEQTAAKANQLMSQINEGRGTMGMLANDPKFASKLKDTVSQMDTLLAQLNAGQGTAGKLLKDPALYDSSQQTMQDAHDLLQAIRKHPKQFLTFHVKLF